MDSETLRCALKSSIDLKEKANEAYREGKYSSAILLYHQSILGIKGYIECPKISDTNGENEKEEDKPSKNTGPSTSSTVAEPEAPAASLELMRKEGLGVLSKCYNNLAACIISGPSRKAEDYLRAVFYCDQVLAIDGENEKAVFRKGCALKLAGKYEKAIAQFKKCSNNSQAAQFAEECRLKELEEDKKRDAQIRANFAKSKAFKKSTSVSKGD